jgi:peptidoglycan/xylan/chitin deacetylase (PgdA/CDA1 family)
MNSTRIAYRLVRYSGLPFMFREVFFRRATRIVAFHEPGPKEFERALAYLRKRYNIISLAEHLSGRPLPAKPLVITFDDGHISNYALLPLFHKAGIHPTMFLCAGIVGTSRRFWFRHAAMHGSSDALKSVSDDERLRVLATTGFTPEREFAVPQALTRAHIEEMKDQVDVQAHGVFHPCLPNCPDEVAAEEIAGPKRILEPLTGAPVTAFAYPNGDYCPRDIELLQNFGYTCGLTVDHGFNRRGDDPFKLKRLSVDDTGNLDSLSVKSSGVWAILTAIIARRRLSGFKAQPMPHAVPAIAA